MAFSDFLLLLYVLPTSVLIGLSLQVIIGKKLAFKSVFAIFIISAILGFITLPSIFMDFPLSLMLVWLNTAMIALYIYYLSVKVNYTFKESVILLFLVLGIVVFSVDPILLLFSHYGLFPVNVHNFLFQTFVQFSLVLIFSYLVKYFSKRWRSYIKSSMKLKNILVKFAIVVFALHQGFSYLIIVDVMEQFTSWSALLIILLAFIILLIIAFLIHINFITIKHKVELQEAKTNALQYYIKEVEAQHEVLQSFKHDYKNILLSMDIFFRESNFEGLKQYYYQHIKTVSSPILTDDSLVAPLQNIKIPEVKSILTLKLMLAHESGVHVSFEAPLPINAIGMNSVDLIRALGIMIDNAVEAVSKLDHGSCQVGFFKLDDGLLIIIKNSCDVILPKLFQLKAKGFSSKGDGRGLGLYILDELVGKHRNVHLETQIDDGYFMQRLMILTS